MLRCCIRVSWGGFPRRFVEGVTSKSLFHVMSCHAMALLTMWKVGRSSRIGSVKPTQIEDICGIHYFQFCLLLSFISSDMFFTRYARICSLPAEYMKVHSGNLPDITPQYGICRTSAVPGTICRVQYSFQAHYLVDRDRPDGSDGS